MFIVRLVVLILLTVISAVLSQSSSLFTMLFFLFSIVLYFYPMYEAYIQKQPDFYSIFALNLFLGWTLIGWVAALVWAIKSVDPIKTVSVNQQDQNVTPTPTSTTSLAPKTPKNYGQNATKDNALQAPKDNEPQIPTEQTKPIKQCPYCAEDILLAAIKCKHCGSQIN